MGSRVISGLVAGLVAVLGAVVVTPAAGLSPPIQESARVVFTNDKRLISINADGTDRRVLTLKNSFVGSIRGLHDTVASGSPGGRSILFVRQDWSERDDKPQGLMSIGADGGDHRMLAATGRRSWVSAATWSRDGSLVYFARTRYRKDYSQVSIHSVRPDGTGLGTLWTGPAVGWEDDEISISGIAPAPAGKLLLTFGGEGDPRLELFDPASGQLSLLRDDAGWGSYSPDGSRIAFINVHEGYGTLHVMAADGSGAVRITPKVRDSLDMRPDWSADGTRIVFQSHRDGNIASEGDEIWSVAPDGGCLSRLTNGTPASTGPVWLGEATDSYYPNGCGDRAPEPLVETQFTKAILELEGHRYWVGPEWDGMLFSDLMRLGTGVSVSYWDCAYFDYQRCRDYREISTAEVCDDRIFPADFSSRLQRIRGAVIALPASQRSRSYSTLFTGGMAVDIQINTARSYAEHFRAVRRLQPVNGRKIGRLPGPVFAHGDVRKAKMVLATWRRDGSLKSFGKSRHVRSAVRGWLRLGKQLEKIGPYRTVRCKGFSNAH